MFMLQATLPNCYFQNMQKVRFTFFENIPYTTKFIPEPILRRIHFQKVFLSYFKQIYAYIK